MQNKSVIIVANFFEKSDTSRPYLMYHYFSQHGYNVKVIYSAFSHSFKKKRIIDGENFLPITTLNYKINISIKRIISHVLFSIKAFLIVKNSQCDIVYINLPPNVLGFPLTLIKRKKKFLLISDVLDLWPETFPLSKLLGSFFKHTYGNILKIERKIILNNSDLIITESEYFFRKLDLSKYKNSGVIHLKKKSPVSYYTSPNISDYISIGYIGNIGTVYDFESLIIVLKKVGKVREIELRILGDGDMKEWLINSLQANKIKYKYFDASFEENVKKLALECCWFGYNGFKENTEVALSYKTIDYFSYGLPIINSAKGDTFNMVKSYNIGYNFSADELNNLSNYLTNYTKEEAINKKRIVKKYFNENFSYASFDAEMTNLLLVLMNK